MATRFYGLIWKWHFIAGLVACPLVAIVAITGALYAFEPEIQRWTYSEVMVVEPSGQPRSVDELAATAAKHCDVGGVSIPGPADRSYWFYCRGTERIIIIDPYRGTILADYDPAKDTPAVAKAFQVIFALHWEMLLGENGRLVVEWATSWTILLLVSGVILWWPRGKRRTGGVLYPRKQLSGRQWLRDLHAVFGAYALPVLFLIAATGLMWTIHAGDSRWNRIAGEGEHEHPTSKVIPGASRIGIDAALAGGKLVPATDSRDLWINVPGGKDKPDTPYGLWAGEPVGSKPSTTENILVDAYSGAEIHREGWAERSTLGKIDGARYAIHVGSLLGLPGRILACIASLILAALCITGPWMWWKRRPAGKLGVPPAARAPWGLYVALAALGWLLPTVGVTLLAFAVIELVRWFLRSRATTTTP